MWLPRVRVIIIIVIVITEVLFAFFVLKLESRMKYGFPQLHYKMNVC